MTARSVDGSVPRISASNVRPSARVTVSLSAPATTWLFVSTWPASSMMTPEPWPPPWPVVAVMLTTLGETAAAVADQSGAAPSAWVTGAGSVPRPSCADDAADGVCAESGNSRTAAMVPPDDRRAASTATAVISAVRRRPERGEGVACAPDGPVGPNGPPGGGGTMLDGTVGMGAVGCVGAPCGAVAVPPRGAYHWGVGCWSLMLNAPSGGD